MRLQFERLDDHALDIRAREELKVMAAAVRAAHPNAAKASFEVSNGAGWASVDITAATDTAGDGIRNSSLTIGLLGEFAAVGARSGGLENLYLGGAITVHRDSGVTFAEMDLDAVFDTEVNSGRPALDWKMPFALSRQMDAARAAVHTAEIHQVLARLEQLRDALPADVMEIRLSSDLRTKSVRFDMIGTDGSRLVDRREPACWEATSLAMALSVEDLLEVDDLVQYRDDPGGGGGHWVFPFAASDDLNL
jgi:hypothetical protein